MEKCLLEEPYLWGGKRSQLVRTVWRTTFANFSAQLSDDLNGKTALLKALLNLRDGKNDTVKVLLDVAARTGDLQDLINASYQDPFYKGGPSSALFGPRVTTTLA